MIIRTHSLKMIAALALVMMMVAGLASCGGGGSRTVIGSGVSPPVNDGGDQMTIMPRPPSQKVPDLEVGAPTVSDSGPAAGVSFTLSATVSNTGDGESPATTLRYYRSTDATITASDLEVGAEVVGALSASGSSSGSVDLTAPSSPGTYYYGACVDAVTGESDTTDNCSSSVQVIVLETQQQL